MFFVFIYEESWLLSQQHSETLISLQMWREEVQANQPCWAPEKQTNISQKFTFKESHVDISQNVLQIYLNLSKYFTEDFNFV